MYPASSGFTVSLCSSRPSSKVSVTATKVGKSLSSKCTSKLALFSKKPRLFPTLTLKSVKLVVSKAGGVVLAFLSPPVGEKFSVFKVAPCEWLHLASSSLPLAVEA